MVSGPYALKVMVPDGVAEAPRRLALAKISWPTETVGEAVVMRRRLTVPAAPAGAACRTRGMRTSANAAATRPIRPDLRLVGALSFATAKTLNRCRRRP